MAKICQACGQPIYSIVGLQFDPLSGIASRNGKSVRLTHSRATIFDLFLQKPGHVVRKSTIENSLYGLKPFADWPDTDSLTVMVCYLRKQVRLLGISIDSVHGVGWVARDGSTV